MEFKIVFYTRTPPMGPVGPKTLFHGKHTVWRIFAVTAIEETENTSLLCRLPSRVYQQILGRVMSSSDVLHIDLHVDWRERSLR